MLDVHPLAELAPRDVVSREIERSWLAAGATTSGSTRGTWARSTCARGSRRSGRRVRRPATTCRATSCRLRPQRTTSSVACASTSTAAAASPGSTPQGEVTASGLHGANRLASNSLLEGLVFSRRIARVLQESGEPSAHRRISWAVPESSPERGVGRVREAALISAEIKDVMQRHVGMSRSDEGLASAAADLEALGLSDLAAGDSATELEVANLLTVGTLIAHAAWLRTESRGCHFRRDFPERHDESWSVRIVQQRGEVPRPCRCRGTHDAVERRGWVARRA